MHQLIELSITFTQNVIPMNCYNQDINNDINYNQEELYFSYKLFYKH